eukprot:COSAG06_NODE_4352_length_4336_cov_125.244749_2_plen_48_part_00
MWLPFRTVNWTMWRPPPLRTAPLAAVRWELSSVTVATAFSSDSVIFA